MSFHCFIGIFVNYFYHVLLHGEGEVLVLYEHVSNIYWYYQGFHSLNATRGLVFFCFFFYHSYQGFRYIVSTLNSLSVDEIVVNGNQICSFIFKDFLQYLISFTPY